MLCIDMNENKDDGKLQRILQSIGLIETSAIFSNQTPLPSHTMGSKQIDYIWVVPQILTSSVSILPHYLGVGDHRCIIADFPYRFFSV